MNADRRTGTSPNRKYSNASSSVSTVAIVGFSNPTPYKYINCAVNVGHINLLLDLCAKVSILHKSFIDGMRPRPEFHQPKLTLRTYNGDELPTLGIVYLPVEYEGQIIPHFEFYVVHYGDNLMGINLFDAFGFTITSKRGSQLNRIAQRGNSFPDSSQLSNDDSRVIPATTSVHDRGDRDTQLPYHLFKKYPELLQSNGLRVIEGFRHKPCVNPNIPPVAQPLRRIPISLESRVLAELEQMERDGIIEPIDASAWVSNMVITPKPNDKIRICGDLRNVNKAITPDKYPLPTVDELSRLFAGATVFSKIDLKSGYWQIEMAAESRYLTSMITPKGLYQWKRVPFGLSSAPSCFQKIIRSIIADCEGTTNLLDDIAIAGFDRQDHDRKLNNVLAQLNKHHATINFEKSRFGVEQIDFVGFTISRG